MATAEDIKRLGKQAWDIIARVTDSAGGDNELTVEEVRRGFQAIVERQFRDVPEPEVYRIRVVAHPTFGLRKNAAGPWTYWNPNINENNFSMDPVEGEVELRLHHFNEALSDAEVTRQLGELGLVREDRLPVILAFLEANPDLQRQFPIITNAAWVDSGGDRSVVYADGGSRFRRLCLSWDVGAWDASCRSLVRRK